MQQKILSDIKTAAEGSPSGGTWHKITEPKVSGSVTHIFVKKSCLKAAVPDSYDIVITLR